MKIFMNTKPFLTKEGVMLVLYLSMMFLMCLLYLKLKVFYEEHVLPEEVIVAHTFESAATEFNELTYLHYTNN